MHTVTIESPGGRLRGRATDDVAAYLGVRYAGAPTGPHRFRPPRPATPAGGIVDATRTGPAAPQSPSRLSAALGPMGIGAQDEDCLTVNVWAPIGATGRPVLVWLHGGAFVTGAGSQPWYDGARLARELGIVVVTVNYRLGALGFLHLPGGDRTPNCGLLDQLAALEWVRTGIAAFGGDPDRVTVAGQSAGAQSILALLNGPAAGRLFRRAILQSAPLGLAPATPAAAAARAELLLAESGIDPQRLRQVPPGSLLAAQDAVGRRIARPLQIAPAFQLVADDTVVPVELRTPAVSGIEVVLSATADEVDAFTAPDPRVRDADRAAVEHALEPVLGGTAADRYHDHARRHPELSPAQVAADLLTDQLFHRDLDPLAQHLRAGGCAVRVERFDWYPAGSPLRACHCIDLPFAFGNLEAWSQAPLLRGADPDELVEQTALVRHRLGLDRLDGPGPGTAQVTDRNAG